MKIDYKFDTSDKSSKHTIGGIEPIFKKHNPIKIVIDGKHIWTLERDNLIDYDSFIHFWKNVPVVELTISTASDNTSTVRITTDRAS